MRILLIDQEKDVLELMYFTILAKFKASVVQSFSVDEAIKIISNRECDLIISDFHVGTRTSADVYSYLLKNKLTIPFILCSSVDPSEHECFNDRSLLIGQIEKSKLHEGISETAQSYNLFQVASDSEMPQLERNFDNYAVISCNLLEKFDKVHCDIYRKKSPTEYEVLFYADDYITSAQLAPVKNADEYLYIEKSESKKFFDIATDQIENLLGNDKIDSEERTISAVDKINDVVLTLGFSEKLIKVTSESVKMTLQTFKQNKELRPLYKRVFSKGRTYLSSHTVGLSYISCGILAKTEWNSLSNKIKMVYASYFHDISLPYNNLNEAQVDLWSDEQIKVFSDHVRKSSEAIRKYQEIPSDVDKIILYHHEDYDGSGPLKITSSRMPSLAAVFAISHKVVDCLIELEKKDIDPSMDIVLQKINADKYTEGNFKKAIEALKQSEIFD